MLKICVLGKICKDGKYRVYGYIVHDRKHPTWLEEDEKTLLAMVVRHIDETDFENVDDVYNTVNRAQSFIAYFILY